jgi:hypothetical protein
VSEDNVIDLESARARRDLEKYLPWVALAFLAGLFIGGGD